MSNGVPANAATCIACPSDRNRSAIPRWSRTSMVRACRPPAREPASSWSARRSTMATSTPANANSPANISPVGPPPAITTACSVIATLRPASRRSPPTHHIPRPLRAVRRRAHPHRRAECPQPHRESHQRFDVPARPIHRQQHTHLATPISVGSGSAILRHDPGLAASPPARYILRVARSGYSPCPLSSAVDEQPPREAAARRVRRCRRPRRISHAPHTVIRAPN